MTRVLLAAVAVLMAASVEAALPAPPFELALSSTSPTEGESVTVRVVPRARGRADGPYDVYVLLASVEEGAFLTPEGAWAPRPVAYARGLSTTDPPVERPWPKAWPAGRNALALVVVPPGGDPLGRAEWRYRPSVRWLRITPLRPRDAVPLTTTLALLGSAAAALLLVVWAGRRAASASGP
jgi:hypothetical protein